MSNEHAIDMSSVELDVRRSEALELALLIADDVSWDDIETYHYTAVVDGLEWSDLKMLHNADFKFAVERAVRYLDLRGLLVRHQLYPTLVRSANTSEEPSDAEQAT